MIGMDRNTGKVLDGLDHLVQSIKDIVTTPKMTRVMRLDYGSSMFDLIDRPINGQLIIDLYAAVADALNQWEPRFRLRRVLAENARAGHLTLILFGEYKPDGRNVEVRLDGLVFQ